MDSEEEYMVVSETDSSSDEETEYRDPQDANALDANALDANAALDPELSAIYDNMMTASSSEQTPLLKTLRRYGIAIVQVDSTVKSTIVDVVNSCQDEAAVVFSTPSEKQSSALYMSAAAFASENYMTNVLLIAPPCEKTWTRILAGWPLNLKIALIADELNAQTFERRIWA